MKQREQQMAKTLNDADNQSTTSDTSSASNKMKTCSQDEDEFDGSVADTEQETDTIKYFCSKCVFTCVDINLFVRHWSEIHKKNVFVYVYIHVLNGIKLQLDSGNMLRHITLMF